MRNFKISVKKIIIFCFNLFSSKKLTPGDEITEERGFQTQTSGNHSVNVQAGRDINVNLDISSIVEDIREEIKTATDQMKIPDDAQSQKILSLIEEGKVSEAESLIDAIIDGANSDYAKKARMAGNLYANINKEKAVFCYKISTSVEKNDYETLNLLALLLLEKGNQEEALIIFNDILQNSDNYNINEKIHGNLGILYKNNGKITKALFHLTKAKELADINNNILGSCKHLNNIGSCHNNIEDAENAENHLKIALELTKVAIEKTNRTSDKQAIKSVQSNVLTNLSITAQKQFINTKDMNYLETAEKYLLTAIEIDDTLNNSISLGRHYGNLANVLRLKGDTLNSRKYIEKSIAAFKKNHSLKDELTSTMNLGRAFAVEGNPIEAMKHYKKSKDQNSAQLYPKLYALTLMNMAYTYVDLQNGKEAKKCAIEAYGIMRNLKIPKYIEMLESDFKISQ